MSESTGDKLARMASEASVRVRNNTYTAEAMGVSMHGVQQQQDHMAHMANIAADQLKNEGR